MIELEQLVSPESLDRFADLLAERLAARQPAPTESEPWDELVDIKEAARRLGRSERWVRDRKNQIGWVKLDGGALAFRSQDLKRYVDGRIVGGP